MRGGKTGRKIQRKELGNLFNTRWAVRFRQSARNATQASFKMILAPRLSHAVCVCLVTVFQPARNSTPIPSQKGKKGRKGEKQNPRLKTMPPFPNPRTHVSTCYFAAGNRKRKSDREGTRVLPRVALAAGQCYRVRKLWLV